MKTVLFSEDQNNNFDISFTNGSIVTSQVINGISQHICLCDGRVPLNLQPIRKNCRGHIADVYDNTSNFSIAWIYSDQASTLDSNLSLLRNSLLNAFHRPEVSKFYKNINIGVTRTNFGYVKIDILLDILQNTYIL